MSNFTYWETCLRCKNNAITTSMFFENGLCRREIQLCPHCGLERFIEFIPRDDHARIIQCYQFGLSISKASNLEYLGFEHINISSGAYVCKKSDGSFEFGCIAGELSSTDVLRIQAHLKSDNNYDASWCYLSRWSKQYSILEVLCGEVPEDLINIGADEGLLKDWQQRLESLAIKSEKLLSYH